MQRGRHSFSYYEIIGLLDPCLNKTLGDVDSANVFDKTKSSPKITGIAGDVVEQSILRYPPDSVQAPDIIIDGVPTEVKAIYSNFPKCRFTRGALVKDGAIS